MKKERVSELIASLLVFLFVYAAVSKWLDLGKFRYQLGQSPFITNIAGLVVWAIPIGELLISALLLAKRTRLIGFYASFFLMSLFTGYIFLMLRYSPWLPCSCGGVLSGMSWSGHFFFNLAFTGLALGGVWLHTAKPSKRLYSTQTGMQPNTWIKK